MAARVDLVATPTGGMFLAQLLDAVRVVADSSVPAATRELVAIRASQINALINTFNQVHVIVQRPAGSYQPTQFRR